MKNVDLLVEVQRLKNMGEGHIAAFIGLASSRSVNEVEWHEDEVWQISVIQFVRLCILTGLSCGELLPDDAEYHAETVTLFGRFSIPHVLRERILGLPDIGEKIGWEDSVLDGWLNDAISFGGMDMLALRDLCVFLKINIQDVLVAYLSDLGRTD